MRSMAARIVSRAAGAKSSVRALAGADRPGARLPGSVTPLPDVVKTPVRVAIDPVLFLPIAALLTPPTGIADAALLPSADVRHTRRTTEAAGVELAVDVPSPRGLHGRAIGRQARTARATIGMRPDKNRVTIFAFIPSSFQRGWDDISTSILQQALRLKVFSASSAWPGWRRARRRSSAAARPRRRGRAGGRRLLDRSSARPRICRGLSSAR